MNLTFEQIKDITLGAARIEECADGVRFFRFTKEQEDAYFAYSDDFYKKSLSTAGIRLEFLTDSRHLSISFTIHPSWSSTKRTYSLAVFVSGNRLGTLGTSDTSGGHFEGTYELPEGENKVTVYLPWSATITLHALTLDDGAAIAHVKKKCRMLMFGDSITHGYEATEPELSYASQLADALDADARNKAIGGEVFFPTLASLRDDFEPDYITVAYGINDWSKTKKEVFDRNCRLFYETLSAAYPGAKIFALTPIWYGREHVDTELHAPVSYVTEYIRLVANDLPNVTCICGRNFVPHDPSCFQPDLLHPNDIGFSHYAESLIAALKEHLPKDAFSQV